MGSSYPLDTLRTILVRTFDRKCFQGQFFHLSTIVSWIEISPSLYLRSGPRQLEHRSRITVSPSIHTATNRYNQTLSSGEASGSLSTVKANTSSPVLYEPKMYSYKPSSTSSSDTEKTLVMNTDIKGKNIVHRDIMKPEEMDTATMEAKLMNIAIMKTEPIDTDTIKTEPMDTVTMKTEPIDTDTIKTEPMDTVTMKIEPIHTDAMKTEPMDTVTMKTESIDTDTIKTEPIHSDAMETEPMDTYLMDLKSTISHTSPTPQAELTVIGTGLASVRQITIEALIQIQCADSIFYLVADRTTELFIEKHADRKCNCFNLSLLDNDPQRSRRATYLLMAEMILRAVRRGERVVGVFYGHPGLFVNPAQRALRIAADDGYSIEILPGISALDGLFADLGIDPSTSGCAFHEASSMVARKKQLDPTNHLVIQQACAVGISTMELEKKDLTPLVDHLEQTYDPTHPVIIYEPATRPLERSFRTFHTLQMMRAPEMADKITFKSILYVPPKTLPRQDAEANACWLLNALRQTEGLRLLQEGGAELEIKDLDRHLPCYGTGEKEVVETIEKFTVVKEYENTVKEKFRNQGYDESTIKEEGGNEGTVEKYTIEKHTVTEGKDEITIELVGGAGEKIKDEKDIVAQENSGKLRDVPWFMGNQEPAFISDSMRKFALRTALGYHGLRNHAHTPKERLRKWLNEFEVQTLLNHEKEAILSGESHELECALEGLRSRAWNGEYLLADSKRRVPLALFGVDGSSEDLRDFVGFSGGVVDDSNAMQEDVDVVMKSPREESD